MASLTIVRLGAAALFSAAIWLVASHAHATPNLVQNGSFEILNPGNAGPQEIANGTYLTGWTEVAPPNSYAFIFATSAGIGPNSLGSKLTGSNTYLTLYGPDSQYVSPDGGNIVGMDGAYQVHALSQTIVGLVAGAQYAVSFDWAGAQQTGFSGNLSCAGTANPALNNCTQDQWLVSLGGAPAQSTSLTTVPNHGFSGWMQQTMTFTASAATQVLSFTAQGYMGSSQPPFALLDGVSMTQVPEPATAAVMLAGLASLGALRLRRRRR